MTTLDQATAKVSAFLSDSRILAEKAKRCKNSNCAFLITGLTPSHCCKLCARTPGEHGPRCQKRLLACGSPGCAYAITGLAPAHCCKMCATGSGMHGPNCWHLAVPTRDTDVGGDKENGTQQADAGEFEARECAGEFEARECAPIAAAAWTDDHAGSSPAGSLEMEETEEERALRIELDSKIEGNDLAIRSNEELILLLREQLAAG